MVKTAPTLAIGGVDTAEKEPLKVWGLWGIDPPTTLLSWVNRRNKYCSEAVDARDFKGVTPLGYAVGHDQLSIVKVLIDGGANLNEVDGAGNSAVHFAAGYGRVKVLEHLLARSASPLKVNKMGLTPLAAAQQNKHQQIVAILQRHGAK